MFDTTEDDRLFICAELDKGTDPDTIADLLTHRKARAAVESIIRREESRKAVQRYNEQRRFSIFAVPAKNSTAKLPRFDQWKVQETDRAAFAAKYGVSEHDLLRVSRGEIE